MATQMISDAGDVYIYLYLFKLLYRQTTILTKFVFI